MQVQFDEDLINKIGQQLMMAAQTVAVAESVSSGMLQLALASGKNAGRFFEGGITAYNIDQKCAHLSVNRQHAQQVDCVSQQVADSMAINICRLFNCHWGLAVTGYATPVPESGNDLFAYFAIAFEGEIAASGRIESNEAAAEEVQHAYCEYILKSFSNKLTAAHKTS